MLDPRGIVRTIANGCDFDDFVGPRVPAGAAVPDHARRKLLREARPASVPASSPRLRRRRARPVRRRLPRLRSRVGRVARARRPARADPLCPPARVAPAPARLRGTAPLVPERGRKREGSAVGKGLRVPRCGQADSRRRPAGRRCGGAHPRDRRRSRGRARRRGGYSAAHSRTCTRASSTAGCPRLGSTTTSASVVPSGPRRADRGAPARVAARRAPVSSVIVVGPTGADAAPGPSRLAGTSLRVWPQGAIRAGVLVCTVVVAASGLGRLDETLGLFDYRADRNAALTTST